MTCVRGTERWSTPTARSTKASGSQTSGTARARSRGCQRCVVRRCISFVANVCVWMAHVQGSCCRGRVLEAGHSSSWTFGAVSRHARCGFSSLACVSLWCAEYMYTSMLRIHIDVHICIYMCMYVCTHMYIYTNIYMHVYIHKM
jgi:hypothetical protein